MERTLSDAQFSVLDEIENNYAYNDFFDKSGAAFPDDRSYEIVQSMNRLVERISLIDSIYIYRSKDRQVQPKRLRGPRFNS